MTVLREVALRGSIAAAADALGFTPAALSQQIAKLEREAGMALVDRGPRSIRPNDAGWALVAHTEAILARLASAESELRALAGMSGGTLRIASFQTVSATILAAALRAFTVRYPTVDVTLAEADPELGLSRLRSGEVELAILWEYDFVPARPDEEIVRVPILDDPIHILLARDHPAAVRPSLRLDQLAQDAWIASTPRSSCHPFTVRACNAAGFEPRISAETNDHHVLERLVADGVGVALVPELSLAGIDPEVVVRPVAPSSPKRRIFAACRRESERIPRVAAMLELLEEAGAGQEQAFLAWRARHLPASERGKLRVAGGSAA